MLLDFTTTHALEDIITDTNSAGRHILLIGACDAVRNILEKQKVLQYIDTDNIHQKRTDALLHAQKVLNDSADIPATK